MLRPRPSSGAAAGLTLIVLVVATLAVALTVVRSPDADDTGWPDGGRCPATAWSGVPLDHDWPTSVIDEIADSGVTTLRISLIWADLQPRRPTAQDDGLEHWKLDGIDRAVDHARSRGLTVNALLTYSPTWASGAPDTSGVDVLSDAGDPGDAPTALPRSHRAPTPGAIPAFGEFTRTIAARYAGRIDGYEIWNEPNLARFFAPGGSGPHGAPDGEAELMDAQSRRDRIDRYASMLAAAGPAIHQGSGGRAEVALGGVSTSARDDGVDIPAEQFVEQVMLRVPEGAVDAVAVHPYTPGNGPEAMPDARRPGNEFAVIDRIHRATGLPQWITEFGAPTVPEGMDVDEVDPASNMVDEDTQARKILTALDQARRLGFVDLFAVYQPFDVPSAGVDDRDPEAHFGLRYADGRPKRAWGPVTDRMRSGCG